MIKVTTDKLNTYTTIIFYNDETKTEILSTHEPEVTLTELGVGSVNGREYNNVNRIRVERKTLTTWTIN